MSSTHKLAVFGAGCFWGVESAFRAVEGVADAAVGYAGGTVPKPNYRTVCGGKTGHAEVVQVEYDPARVSFEQLLEVLSRPFEERPGYERYATPPVPEERVQQTFCGT